MKKPFLAILALVLSLPSPTPLASPRRSLPGVQPPPPSCPIPTGEAFRPYAPGQVIARLSPELATTAVSDPALLVALSASAGVGVQEIRPLMVYPDERPASAPTLLERYFVLHLDCQADIPAVIAALSRHPQVELAVPNGLALADRAPSDEYFANQWSLRDDYGANLRFELAWNITTGSPGVTVAVLDSGLDLAHPDLAGRYSANGYDFADGDPLPEESHGHGTAVAGVIGAASNNTLGVAGVAWGVQLMPVKVCRPVEPVQLLVCEAADILNGIRWAADHGAAVLNLSLTYQGSEAEKAIWQEALDYAFSRGVKAVATSAGNNREHLDGVGPDHYLPNELAGVLAVGATNPNDEICQPSPEVASNCLWRTKGSGFGPLLDLVAPGSADIWTTFPGGYTKSFGGTSAAAPFVAGLAALVLSINPSLTPAQVEAALTQTARDLGAPGRDDQYGWGRIDAYAALLSTPTSSGYFAFKFRLQGVEHAAPSQPLSLTLAQGSSVRYSFPALQASSDPNGGFYAAVDQLQPGYYTAFLKGAAHLQQGFYFYQPAGVVYVDWSNAPLPAGDLRGESGPLPDNDLTLQDLQALLGSLADLSAPAAPGAREDLDLDGYLTSHDLALALSNYHAAHNPGQSWTDPLFLEYSALPKPEPPPTDTLDTAAGPPTTATASLPEGAAQGEAPAAARVSAWQWPVNRSRNPGLSTSPALACGSDGTLHLAWTDAATGSYQILYAWRSPSGAWGGPQAAPASGGGRAPSLAVDLEGGVHLAWQSGAAAGEVYYAYKPPGGDFAAPINLSNNPANSSSPTLAVDGAGRAHLAWVDASPGNADIFQASQDSNGAWSSPANLSQDAAASTNPDLAVGPDSSLHLVWQEATIMYRSRLAGGGWGATDSLPGSASASQPAVAAGPDGRLHAVWAGAQVMYASRPSGGSWSAPQAISAGQIGSQPDLALDLSGLPHAAWTYFYQVYAAHMDPSTGWSAPQNASSSYAGAQLPALCLDRWGIAHLAWNDKSASNDEIHYSYALPQGGLAGLRLDPPQAVVKVGQEIPVDLGFDAHGLPVATLAISLTYPYQGAAPGLALPDSDPGREGVQIGVDSGLAAAGWVEVVNRVEAVAGQVSLRLLLANLEPGGARADGGTPLAHLPFVARSSFVDLPLTFDQGGTQVGAKLGGVDASQAPGEGRYSALQEPTAVQVSGPPSGLEVSGITFLASAAPLTATLPLQYTWQASGLPGQTHSGGLTDSATFIWPSAGSAVITVTVSNPVGSVFSIRTIAILEGQKTFLPLLFSR